MSLDVSLIKKRTVFDYNITHNLNKMAMEVKIGEYSLYEYLWRPEEIDIFNSNDLIKPLKIGLKELKDNPDKYKQFNPDNGWGEYSKLVEFVKKYLDACEWNEDCEINISR